MSIESQVMEVEVCWITMKSAGSDLKLLMSHLNILESSFNSNGTIGWELAVLHTTPYMFGKFAVHAWR